MAGTTGRRWKCRGRPCSECGRWFRPHPRAGVRQVTCSETCRGARRERACKAWREANAITEQEERLRQRLRRPVATGGQGKIDPMAQIQWEVVRNSVSPEAGVIIKEVTQILVSWVRSDMAGQVPDK